MTLSGCTTGTKVRPPDLMLPAELVAASDPNNGLPEETRWWQHFGDAQLDGLVVKALERNSDVGLALQQIEIARAQRAQALAAFSLQGSTELNAQARRTEITSGRSRLQEPAGAGSSSVVQEGSERTAAASIALSWEVDIFRRAQAARDAGDAAEQAALATSGATRLAVAAAVADALFEARGLTVQRDHAVALERIQARLQAYVVARERVGLSTRSDVERVLAQQAQSRAEILRLQAELVAAKRRLLTLARADPQPVSDLVLDVADTRVPPAPASLPNDLLQLRPDVQAAAQRMRAAASRLRAQDLELLPRLLLQPGATLTGLDAPVRASTASLFVGVRFTVPLFERQRLLSAVREQGAVAEQAVIEYEKTAEQAFSEAEQAAVALQAEQRRLGQLVEASTRARNVLDGALRLFSRNYVDLRTVLDAERESREAKQAMVASHVACGRRAIDLARALGGAWPSVPLSQSGPSDVRERARSADSVAAPRGTGTSLQ